MVVVVGAVVVVVGSVVDVVVVDVVLVDVDVVVVGGGGHAEAADAPAVFAPVPAISTNPIATAEPIATACVVRLRIILDARKDM
jgi:hypothetical protein